MITGYSVYVEKRNEVGTVESFKVIEKGDFISNLECYQTAYLHLKSIMESRRYYAWIHRLLIELDSIIRFKGNGCENKFTRQFEENGISYMFRISVLKN